jgi:hypothetical protein
MNEIIQKWRLTRNGNIPMNRNFKIDTMLFGDQILLTKSEDDLQYSVHNLNNIVEEFSMEINTGNTKIMAFCGMEQIRSKAYNNNRILEQVNTFNCLGCNIFYEGEKDLNMKGTNSVKVV